MTNRWTTIDIEAMLHTHTLITGLLIGYKLPQSWSLFFPDLGIHVVGSTLSDLFLNSAANGISDVIPAM